MNCQLCEKGYYRPAGVSRFDPEPCAACDCDTFGSVGVWDGFPFQFQDRKRLRPGNHLTKPFHKLNGDKRNPPYGRAATRTAVSGRRATSRATACARRGTPGPSAPSAQRGSTTTQRSVHRVCHSRWAFQGFSHPLHSTTNNPTTLTHFSARRAPAAWPAR